jgi:hypothetical protein
MLCKISFFFFDAPSQYSPRMHQCDSFRMTSSPQGWATIKSVPSSPAQGFPSSEKKRVIPVEYLSLMSAVDFWPCVL